MKDTDKQAASADRIKSRFLADIAHEIRTPMSGIDGFADLLLNSKLDDAQKEYVNAIKHSSQNLLAIVNNLLDLTRLESGKFDNNPEPFNLRECVEDVITILTPSIYEQDIDLILFIYSDVPERIIFDAILFRQLLINLIGNSIKFTEHGKVIIRVMLEDENKDSTSLKFTITDTGVGISKNDISHLFEAFSQSDGPHIGSGLGLSICKNIIKQVDGNIGVESEKGKGSTFWFTLDCPIDTNAENPPAVPKLSGKNIVLYDSDEASLLALRHAMNKAGAHPLTANHINEVSLIPRKNTDLSWQVDGVYLSLSREECASEAYIQEIKLIAECYDCPVIVLAYCSEKSVVKKLDSCGISKYLAKPARLSLIASALDKSSDIGISSTPDNTLTREALKKPMAFHRIKVLVAEDNDINAKLIKTILRQCGINPVLVKNGKEAVDRFSQGDIDLVLMDIHMPVMDGVEATKLIRNIQTKHIPVFAITANAISSEIEKFHHAGIDECLIKPIQASQLFHLFNEYLDIDLSPDYSAMNDVQKKILAGEGASLTNELIKYKLKILTSIEEKDRQGLFEHTHKLHGIASFFKEDRLGSAVCDLEILIKKHGDFNAIASSANVVFRIINETVNSREAI